MKKVKVSLLALCALAGGAMVASAAKGDSGFTYDLDVTFTNPVTLVDISGVPQVNTNFSLSAGGHGVAMTDGSGKIDGVWDMYITNLTASTPLVDGDYIVDLGGSITTTTTSGNPAPTAVVNMTMKGNGRSHDDGNTTNGPASFSLTFNSKNAGGVKTNSSVATFGTNNVTRVFDNGNGTFTTNSSTDVFSPVTNVVFQTAPFSLPFLTFTVHTSDTNASPVDNEVFEQSNALSTNFNNVKFYFGSGTLISNLYFQFGTNFVQISSLGTNINFSSFQPAGAANPIIDNNTTDVVYGIDIASVPTFINAFEQANTSTNNPFSLVSGVVTNTDKAAGNSPNDFATNVTYVTGIPTFSNAWLEVPGLVSGSVKQGKKSTSVKNASGLFTTEHVVYTPLTVTNTVGSNTVVTNYVIVTEVGGGSIDLESTKNFHAKVVQFNKSLWSSSSEGFSGKGSASPTKTKQTYTLTQKGVSQSRGSSLTFKGNTDSNYVAGITVLTNVVTVTNLASLGKVTATFTNTTAGPIEGFSSVLTTNVVISPGPVTNTIVSLNTFDVTIPPSVTTNIDTLGIRTVTATGKIKGQALPKTGISGVNPDNL